MKTLKRTISGYGRCKAGISRLTRRSKDVTPDRSGIPRTTGVMTLTAGVMTLTAGVMTLTSGVMTPTSGVMTPMIGGIQ
jgi:hypothetical protein